MDDNFRPDGPFLVRVAVLVRVSLPAPPDFDLSTISGLFAQGTKPQVFGHRSRLNWKTSGTRSNRNSEFLLLSFYQIDIVLQDVGRVLSRRPEDVSKAWRTGTWSGLHAHPIGQFGDTSRGEVLGS